MHYIRADNLADAAGHPHLFDVRTARTRSNAPTLADESKLTLIFCEKCGDTQMLLLHDDKQVLPEAE
jgi:hypothetical protein